MKPGFAFFSKEFLEKSGGVQVMLSLSEKGKLGGKKLSTDEQLLVLQDALTLGVSELQLAIGGTSDNDVNRDEPGEEGGKRSLCESEGGGRRS